MIDWMELSVSFGLTGRMKFVLKERMRDINKFVDKTTGHRANRSWHKLSVRQPDRRRHIVLRCELSSRLSLFWQEIGL